MDEAQFEEFKKHMENFAEKNNFPVEDFEPNEIWKKQFLKSVVQTQPNIQQINKPCCGGERNKILKNAALKKTQPTWKKEDLKFIKLEQLVSDTRKLIKFIPPKCCGIICCFRSGAIPAGVLATNMHLPMFELTYTGLRPLTGGFRSSRIVNGKMPKGPYFLVDDTSHDGGQIRRARKILKNYDVIYSAVYVKNPKTVNYFSEILPSPHLLEWNLIGGGNGIMCGHAVDLRLRGFGIGLDFDGILCEDCDFQHKDEEEDRVIDWILNAIPKYMPRYCTIPLIVSMRLEKHRKYIEQWLEKWELKFNKLILHPSKSFKERDENFNYAEHKGLTAAKFKTSMFIESDDRQAQGIANISNCPVVVPNSGKIYLK